VDPGVGSERRAVLVRAGGKWVEQWFVAPDNGLLGWVLAEADDYEAWLLENPEYFLSSGSNTFHGRDIFSPVAAHLAAGVAPDSFGRKLADADAPLTRLACLPQMANPTGETEGQIVLVDRFGNLLTNLRGSSLPDQFTLQIGGHTICELLTNYAQGKPGKPFAIVGSSGLLEVAVTQGSAAELLRALVGAAVLLKSVTPETAKA